MPWSEAFIVLLLCHLTGDFLLQTDWQAENKHGGLGADAEARRALLSHLATYTLAFLPAVIWIGSELDAGAALVTVGLIFSPICSRTTAGCWAATWRSSRARARGRCHWCWWRWTRRSTC